jgi:hypothetical protein
MVARVAWLGMVATVSAEAYLDGCEAWLQVAQLSIARLKREGYAGNVPPITTAIQNALNALAAFDSEWKRSLQEPS